MKKQKKKGKSVIVVFGIISFVILIVLVASYVIITHFYKKMNYVPLDKGYKILEETHPNTEDVSGEVTEPVREDTPQEQIDEYIKAAREAAASLGVESLRTEDVYNILLVGSDTRTPGQEGRSDTMMLVSINNKTKHIVCTSFLRDLYVYIPHKDYWDKINAAFAYGGIDLLLETIEYNFSLPIDKYIMVDFFSFVNVVDLLGGLDVDVKEDELYWCNQYIHASNLLLGEDEDSDYLKQADGSYQHLSGKQVLAYSRFRYVGNADFSRTERQRKVVNLMFEKLKTTSASMVIELLNGFLPEVTTNITKEEFIDLISILPQVYKYDVISWGVPDQRFEYINVNKQSHIGIDFSYYIGKIYGLIYTDKTLDDYNN